MNIKKLTITAIFGLAAAAAGLTIPPAVDSRNDSIRHEKLKNAGVLIPITNPQRLPDGNIQFEVHAKNVSKRDYMWSKLWGKDFGYYVEGTGTDGDRACPYFEARDKTSFRSEPLEDSQHLRFTLGMAGSLIDELVESQCALSPPPGDSIAPPMKEDNNRGGARAAAKTPSP